MKRILILMLAVMFLFSCATVKDVAVDTVKEVGSTAIDSGSSVVDKKVEAIKNKAKEVKSKLTKKEIDNLWGIYGPIRDTEKLARESYKKGSEVLEAVIKTTENTIKALDAFGGQVFMADDIKVWKYNNLGSYRIDEFKKLTNYKVKMATIEAMEPSEEKIKYQKETIELFTKCKSLLTDGLPYVQVAKEMNAEMFKKVKAAGNNTKKYEDRAVIIQNNIDYIDWVLKHYTK